MSGRPSDADGDASDVRGPPRTSAGRHAVRHSTRRLARQVVRPAICRRADCHPDRRTEWPSASQPLDGAADQWSEWPSARADRRVEWPSAGERPSRTCGRPDVSDKRFSNTIFPKDIQSDNHASQWSTGWVNAWYSGPIFRSQCFFSIPHCIARSIKNTLDTSSTF
jgi:hypothetical protein